MKTIGKVAALAMTLSLAFVLSACGGGASSGASSSSAAASSASASASASSASASAESAAATASSASAAAESAAAEATSEAAQAKSATTSEGTSEAASTAVADADQYNNEFFGVHYDLPEGWSFTDVSGISGINSVVAAAAKEATPDMIAMNGDHSQIVIANIEKANDENAGLTAEQYLDKLSEQMQEGLEGNYSYTSNSATITFAGIERELPANVVNLDVNGNKLYICEAVAEKDGNFLQVISMAGSEDAATGAFNNFSSTVQ